MQYICIGSAYIQVRGMDTKFVYDGNYLSFEIYNRKRFEIFDLIERISIIDDDDDD